MTDLDNVAMVECVTDTMHTLKDGTLIIKVVVEPAMVADAVRVFSNVGTPAVLARLDQQKAKEMTISRNSLVTSAVLVCKDDVFQEYVSANTGGSSVGEEEAASYVRNYCDVISRSDLKDARKGEVFHKLMREFNEWRRSTGL